MEASEREKAIDTLVEFCIEKGLISEAFEAVKLKGGNLASKEINSLMEVCVKQAGIYTVQKMAKLRTSQEVIDSLVKFYIDKGWIRRAVEVAKLGASQEVIDSLVESCIKKGFVKDALEAVKLRGKDLTAEEIISLVESVRSR